MIHRSPVSQKHPLSIDHAHTTFWPNETLTSAKKGPAIGRGIVVATKRRKLKRKGNPIRDGPWQSTKTVDSPFAREAVETGLGRRRTAKSYRSDTGDKEGKS